MMAGGFTASLFIQRSEEPAGGGQADVIHSAHSDVGIRQAPRHQSAYDDALALRTIFSPSLHYFYLVKFYLPLELILSSQWVKHIHRPSISL